MDENTIEIDTPDAATAAYIMSELVGRIEAALVPPPTSGGHWCVTLRRARDGHELLLAAIGAVERALGRNDLAEATVRFGRRSYTLRTPGAIPPQTA